MSRLEPVAIGPWHTYSDVDGGACVAPVADPESVPISIPPRPDGSHVATADLVAAAPLMLAALARARTFIWALPGGGGSVLDDIDDAITSARKGAEAALLQRQVRRKERERVKP